MERPVVNEEIIRLIEAQTEALGEEAEYYTLLAEKVMDEDDKAVLRSIILKKKKHMRILRELYYRLKGSRPEGRPLSGSACPGENLTAEFRRAALHELEAAETYRSLIFDFLNQSIRDSFVEIMTDSQNNSARLSLLLAKYS